MNELHYNAVVGAFKRCAYPIGKKVKKNAVRVEGIFGYHFFFPEELEAERELLTKMLRELPDKFVTTDGSSSGHFTQLGAHRDGSMWCGDNPTKEMLFLMASGLGMAKFTLPRELWLTCPNNLPYISVIISEEQV